MKREEIIEQLTYFEKADPDYEVFGANTHFYALYLPLEIAIIRKYEASQQIQLPSDFVKFYTQISDGGAGPHYGLYSGLRELTVLPTPLLAKKCLDIGIDFDQVDYEDTRKLVDTYHPMKEIVEELGAEQALIQVLEIGEYGCGYFIYLVVSGQDYGKVVLGINYQEAEIENRKVVYPTYDILYPDFESYFTDWLGRILSHQIKVFINKKK